MKTDFSINVLVNLGVTPEMGALLGTLLSHRPTVMPPLEEASDKQQESETTADAVQTVAVAAPEPTDEKTDEPAKEYTTVDVRAAMDKTRKRIEGENYKEQADSEGYKKWHRALSAWFKGEAVALGADKPSSLPDSKSREAFISRCNLVEAVGDKLEVQPPF